MAIQAESHSIIPSSSRALLKAAGAKAGTATVVRQSLLPANLEGKKPIGQVHVPVDDSSAYALYIRGNCLSPTIRDGDQIVCSPATKLVKDTYVVISFKNGAESMVKVLDFIPYPPHSNDEITVMYRVRQTNLPTFYFFDPSKIDCIHAVVGIVREGKYIALEAGRAQ